jgi:hypothetical protein
MQKKRFTELGIGDERRFVTGKNQNSGQETANETIALISEQDRP